MENEEEKKTQRATQTLKIDILKRMNDREMNQTNEY